MRAWMRAALLTAMLAVTGMSVLSGVALGDGDPGSDVLVYQDLFVAGDAGMSVAQQAQLGVLLKTADRNGFPIRVAIVSSPADLGAVGALWRKPQAYARFLGYELSLAYRQRLLVVMPNGFGFNWPGHPATAAIRELTGLRVGSSGGALFSAASSAVRTLAAASGVRLAGSAAGSGAAAGSAGGGAPSPPSLSAPERVVNGNGGAGGSSSPGHSADTTAAAVGGVVVLLVALLFGGRYLLARRRRDAAGGSPSPRPARPGLRARLVYVVPALILLALLAAAGPILLSGTPGASGAPERTALASNPYLDPGTTLSGPAPDFTLINQFGRPLSLHSLRGKVVVLAFTDSECTTVCPMTTTAMLDAKAMLGSAGSHVALVGVNANPASTSIEDVASYSELHGMTHAWNFLTGTLPELRRVWKAYGIEAAVQRGLTSHTPALLVITPQGREAKVYMTQESYGAIGQLGQILAQEASSLLPGHPPVNTRLSYAPVKPITPAQTTVLPRAGGGSVTLGPARSSHLYVFFATWDQEITSLGGNLDALDRYAAVASRSGLPPLTAVDEGGVEPSRGALPAFLSTLAQPLTFPVAIDRSGQLADGYQVLGQPWFVLVSPTGRILWYRDVSTSGWPSDRTVIAQVRAALARAPSVSGGAVASALARSPAPLAALHRQAGQLLGGQSALESRLRALRGYPVVINAWASWCTPCRSEFGLFAAASAQYGRKVAFIGADTNDSAGDAGAFLAQHPVSYPSYQTTTSALSSLAPVGYLPTTVFINRRGRVVDTHIGQYDTQGSLNGDIATYAIGG